MGRYWTETHSFTNGAARSAEICHFSITQDDLSDEEVPHTIFGTIYEGKWYQDAHVNWAAVGIGVPTVPSPKIVAIGEDGQIWTYVGGSEGTEDLGVKPRLLRNLASIGGELYACGMDRQVFRRVGEGSWTEMHASQPASDETVGFEAIHGYSEQELYAVGWEGEIWWYDGSLWRNCDSPVNIILTAVHCASNGTVYVCGQEGLVLVGREDTWRVLEDDDLTQDIWDVIEFNSRIYFATKTDVYELREEELHAVEAGSEAFGTTGRFSEKEGVLWSVGEKDVFSFDSENWTRID